MLRLLVVVVVVEDVGVIASYYPLVFRLRALRAVLLAAWLQADVLALLFRLRGLLVLA